MRKSATKQICIRVGQQAFDNLDYLAKLTGKTQGNLVGDLINDLTEAIRQAAIRRDPALKDNPEFRMNSPRGPVISTEEQQAWQAIRRMWNDIGLQEGKE